MLDVINTSVESRRAAINAERNHRLDIDRVIYAALNRLEASAYEAAGSHPANVNGYLSFAVGTESTHDVLSLIQEIRGKLSPVVRTLTV